MSSKKNIKINNILVIGLGLIGASLCRSLKSISLYKKIYGHDTSKEVMQYALKNNYVDDIKIGLKEGISESDLIIICVPVHKINDILEVVKNYFNSEKVFTDTLSSKKSLLNFIDQKKFNNVNNFISSHPMAGTENFGIENSKSDLYDNSTTFICPLDFSDPCKIEKVNEMWKAINSKTTNLDIRNHDKYLAILSHAPHAISFALSKKTNEKELLKKLPWMYSKGSLSEILRVANSDSNAWASIFKDNQDNLAEYLEEYIQELKELKFSIMNGSVEELASYLKKSKPTK